MWVPCGVSYIVQCLHKDVFKANIVQGGGSLPPMMRLRRSSFRRRGSVVSFARTPFILTSPSCSTAQCTIPAASETASRSRCASDEFRKKTSRMRCPTAAASKTAREFLVASIRFGKKTCPTRCRRRFEQQVQGCGITAFHCKGKQRRQGLHTHYLLSNPL